MDILAAIMADPNVSPDLKRMFGAAADSAAVSVTPNDPANQDVADILDAVVLRRVAYASALARHDWSFERSDDYSAWSRGKAEMIRLRSERAAVDPDGVIWNRIAPEGYRTSKVLA